MLGYIYHITNQLNGKKYIGKTNNAEHRLEQHYSALKKGTHHSIKLQRAFNKHGWENFKFTYRLVKVSDENELNRLEIQEIEKYDSYQNGYNETLGGEGKSELFDFSTRCTIYQMCKKYGGIKRKLARLLNCDDSSIRAIADNDLYNLNNFNQDLMISLEQKLSLTEKDLVENYIPHNDRKLTKKQVFEFMSVVDKDQGYTKLFAKEFNVGSTVTFRLSNKIIYKDFISEYEKLSEKEKQNLYEETLKKYDLQNKKAKSLRYGNILSQEQVDYILDNQNIKKRIEIAKDLGISADRVGNVILGKSYKDLVSSYKNRHPDN